MKRLHHPSFIGAMVVGILFNVVLGVLGMIGFELIDAMYLTTTLLTIVFAVGVHYLIQGSRSD